MGGEEHAWFRNNQLISKSFRQETDGESPLLPLIPSA